MIDENRLHRACLAVARNDAIPRYFSAKESFIGAAICATARMAAEL
ncbi:hypothetical protein [Paraburkholderia sp. SIMBA_030]